MSASRVVLVGKPGCHLCDTAREVVTTVTDRLGAGFEERSILDDAALYERYWERIPVVLVDDVVVDYWQVDPARLEKALSRP